MNWWLPGGKEEYYRYDGKNKQVNKLVIKILVGWVLLLLLGAYLGSKGVVLPLK